jgi:hypothetical protein
VGQIDSLSGVKRPGFNEFIVIIVSKLFFEVKGFGRFSFKSRTRRFAIVQ